MASPFSNTVSEELLIKDLSYEQNKETMIHDIEIFKTQRLVKVKKCIRVALKNTMTRKTSMEIKCKSSIENSSLISSFLELSTVEETVLKVLWIKS